jgi:hypothetical protein
MPYRYVRYHCITCKGAKLPYRTFMFHCSVCDVAFYDIKGARRCEERHAKGESGPVQTP